MSRTPFNENLRGPRFLRELIQQHNRIARCLNNLRGDGVIPNEFDGYNFRFAGSDGLDLSIFAFGWLGTTGQTVSIREGFIEGRVGYHIVPGATVSVGGNESAPHLIVVTGDDQGGAIAVNSVLESAYSGDTADVWKRVLYRVYLRNGVPFMDMVGSGVGGVVL